jgi:uncharacterized protein YbbK (DUF523 family)
MIASHIESNLKEHVDFIPICPEVEIGLGIPHPTLRMVRSEDGDHLIQPDRFRDITREMNHSQKKF